MLLVTTTPNSEAVISVNILQSKGFGLYYNGQPFFNISYRFSNVKEKSNSITDFGKARTLKLREEWEDSKSKIF